MLAHIAAVFGISMTQGQVIPTIKANNWGFVSVPVEVLGSADAAESIRFIVEGQDIREVVPSWTGRAENGASITFKVRPLVGVDEAQFFSLGTWAQGVASSETRSSKNDQEDESSKVSTDTWQLKQPILRFEVLVERKSGVNGEVPRLSDLSFVLSSDSRLTAPDSLPVWGTLLDVPKRAQMSYENGGVLCSPTAVSMILGYWARRMETPTLDIDVPVVQAEVYDPGWDGTGNWPFNVAFAGSQPGMTGYVTRLRGISDLEAFVGSGVPVATSVSYGLLKGQGKKNNDGHLVVVVGFDGDGTPIFNDPGRNVVRMTYAREDFKKAWAYSKNTVYVIHPRGWKTPKNGPWPEQKERD